MKLTTKKYVAFFVACLVISFSLVSFLGIHSRWGYTIHNHFKGWQNLRFGYDLSSHNMIKLKPEIPNVNVDNKQIMKTMKNRLNALGFFDHRISVDKAENSLVLEYAQPAGTRNYDTQTVVDIVGMKGDFSINSSVNLFEKPTNVPPIGNNDIQSAKLTIKQKDEYQQSKDANPEYSIVIQLKKSGIKKLENLTNQIIDYNILNASKKKDTPTENKHNKQKKANLTISINSLEIDSKQVNNPIKDGKIEISGTNLNLLKQSLIYLKNPELPSSMLLYGLRKISPDLGNEFVTGSMIILMAVLVAAILVLAIKFKLIGLVCSVCLIGHSAFILACFTGFFRIYPGVVFNLGSLVGSMVSLAIGIASCFLIAKSIEKQQTLFKVQPFSLAIKNGLESAGKLISSLNRKLIVGSIIMMAFFSYKTNLFSFLLQPLYNLLDIEMLFDPTISAVAYALFVGSVGALIFEKLIIKYIMSPITSPQINLNFKKIITDLKLNKQSNKNKGPKNKQPKSTK